MVAPVIIGKARFEALPQDVQKALLEAGAEAAAVERQTYQESDQRNYEALQKLSVHITHPDTAALRAASEPIYDKHVTSEAQKQLLQMIRNMD